MQPLRSQRGQTGTEFLGIIVLVAAVIGMISQTNLGGRISGTLVEKVCEIGGGDDCAGSADRGDTNRADDSQPRPPDSGRAPRKIFDADCGDLPGDALGDSGNPPTDGEAADVFRNLGQTYDYYLDTFGRESFDDENGDLLASLNLCGDDGKPLKNAYWNGEQMAFGPGYGESLDVTAHELTHAVTERTAGLEYKCQSGALNESMSDIFGSNLDPEDWEIGEDLPGGAIRDMEHPERFGDPATVADFDTRPNDDDPFNDHGGVHTNSAIPNRVYVLMVQTMGRDAAEQIVFRALTEGLDKDSGFEDFRTAALDAAAQLYGTDGPERAATNAAFAEVGLDGTWEAPEIKGC